jgi:Family of unknown function (DUF5758)/MORN repeat variant
MTDHVGYKKCQNGRIVQLEILGDHNEERKDVADKNFAMMRCSRAKVTRIYNMHSNSECREAFGIYDKSFRYEVGSTVEPDQFDLDLDKVCSGGIHYFLTEYRARCCAHRTKNGLRILWYENGQMRERYTVEDGKRYGLYELWYINGQMAVRYTYLNEQLDGLCERWYENGQSKSKHTFLKGNIIKN